jgi:glucose dehydrogenase
MIFKSKLISTSWAVFLLTNLTFAQTNPNDWPSYNHDLLGYRFNPGEKSLSPSNVRRLEEKWRFPEKGSKLEIGVIHATPIVVDGYVYFGTATDPAFYKLAPDGKVRWVYKTTDGSVSTSTPPPKNDPFRLLRFTQVTEGIMASAAVSADTVYFCDMAGKVYALDRGTGKERWKLNTRDKRFPNAHAGNVLMSSPIVADGKLIVAGGTLEQVMAAALPFFRGSTGRGFVAAIDPKSGDLLWKYDLGPKPAPHSPPMRIKDSWREHVFHFGPATSSIWCTPSFDEQSGTLYFGTDVNTSPRRPTPDNPRTDTPESCAVVALNIKDGSPRWIRQINSGDVWTNAMRSYDPKAGKYKDQAIGDTPKIYTINHNGRPTKVVGCGCKNGGFYVIKADDGEIIAQTPIYTGPPTYPLNPQPDPRMIALPSCIGGLQTGCATDGKTIFTNGIDALKLASQERQLDGGNPPTGGRVVALSLDTKNEHWRHDRPRVATVGGPAPKPVWNNVGDPVASGIAVANGVLFFTGVASGKLVALDSSNGSVLKEITIGPVWSGPSISRGRVSCGSGNTLFTAADYDAFFPKKYTGTLYSFGLPGEDEVSKLGSGKE